MPKVSLTARMQTEKIRTRKRGEELLTESMKTHLQSKRQEAKMAVISELLKSLPTSSEMMERNVRRT